LLTSTIIADSFAGERERHTLETLLASRLSDRAILFGKVASAVSYAWGLILGMVLLGLLTVNVVAGHGKLLMYPLPTLLASVCLSLLFSLLAASIGVPVSLRAATVKQAQQTLSFVGMFFFIIPIIVIPMLPAGFKMHAMQAFRDLNLVGAVLAIGAVLLAVDLLLLSLVISRFQRAKLILD
jgi:ABC-2 type transport system permease protein